MMVSRKTVARYAFLGLINSVTVYAVYTPYVFLWVHYSWDQYVRWLAGGIPMSLAFGWLFAVVMLHAAKWYDQPSAPSRFAHLRRHFHDYYIAWAWPCYCKGWVARRQRIARRD